MCAGIRVNPRGEEQRVAHRLNALADGGSQGASSFWSDRSRGHILATLQDRVGQVEEFVECCRSALAVVHSALFPLDEAPQGLYHLMRKFRRGEAIFDFVREQLIGGAKVALAFVRVHHPRIDLEVVGSGLPPPPGGGRVQMVPHYEAALRPAMNIVRLVEAEDNEFLRLRREAS